jgi:hypothetical protein
LLRGSWDVLMQRATYSTQFTQLALQLSACEDRYVCKAYEQDATDYGTYDLRVPPYVMLLMRANPLRGRAEGGWALEIETFVGPCELAWSHWASAIWGPKKLR